TRFCNGSRSRRILAPRAAAHIGCRFVPMFAEIKNLPQEPTRRPFGIAYLDHFRQHPMNLRQVKRRPKAALAAYRRAPCGRRKALEPSPKAAQARRPAVRLDQRL